MLFTTLPITYQCVGSFYCLHGDNSHLFSCISWLYHFCSNAFLFVDEGVKCYVFCVAIWVSLSLGLSLPVLYFYVLGNGNFSGYCSQDISLFPGPFIF